jgi:predicted transcriptional regulator
MTNHPAATGGTIRSPASATTASTAIETKDRLLKAALDHLAEKRAVYRPLSAFERAIEGLYAEGTVEALRRALRAWVEAIRRGG